MRNGQVATVQLPSFSAEKISKEKLFDDVQLRAPDRESV